MYAVSDLHRYVYAVSDWMTYVAYAVYAVIVARFTKQNVDIAGLTLAKADQNHITRNGQII